MPELQLHHGLSSVDWYDLSLYAWLLQHRCNSLFPLYEHLRHMHQRNRMHFLQRSEL